MPTYNGAAFVAEALASVYRQTLRPCEIIVVDDCSRDATPAMITALARRAPVPIRLIALKENCGGPARPLNKALAAASGEFIAILDQDDVFTPTKLEDQVGWLARDPRLAFVFSVCGRYDRPAEAVASQAVLQLLRARGTDVAAGRCLPGADVFRLLLRHGNFIIGYPGMVFRRKDWQRKGGLDERLSIASDYEFFSWLCLQGEVGFLDEIHYLRRFHAQNLCNRLEATRIEAYRVQAHYLIREPWVLEDTRLAATLRDNIFDLAYLLRQRGSYREALRYYLLSLRALGWETRAALAMVKLMPHWMRRKIRNGSNHEGADADLVEQLGRDGGPHPRPGYHPCPAGARRPSPVPRT